jgi:hypothetical protein
MPYEPSKDSYAFTSGFALRGRRLSAITASPDDLLTYPKALAIFVPTGTAGPHLTILPLANEDGQTIALTLNEGYQVLSEIGVRAVTSITAGVVVRRIDD